MAKQLCFTVVLFENTLSYLGCRASYCDRNLAIRTDRATARDAPFAHMFGVSTVDAPQIAFGANWGLVRAAC